MSEFITSHYQQRKHIQLAMLLLCFAPLIWVFVYASQQPAWDLVVSCVFGTAVVAACFLLGFQYVETLFQAGLGAKTEAVIHEGDRMRLQDEILAKQQQIARLKAEIQEFEKNTSSAHGRDEKHRLMIESLEKEGEQLKKELSQGQLVLTQRLEEYQQTISGQREIIEKKQEYIAKLEARVRELSVEVKTLLQLGDVGKIESEYVQQAGHPLLDALESDELSQLELDELYKGLPASADPEVYSPYDAAVLLRRCVATAEKFTGARHLRGEGQSSLELSPESYAIDLRRLCDYYRNERNAAVFLYFPDEQRVAFINQEIKGIVGHTPEYFAKEFFQCLVQGQDDWIQAVAKLLQDSVKSDESNNSTQLRLLMRNANNQEQLVRVLLSVIRRGIFAGRVVAVLYKA